MRKGSLECGLQRASKVWLCRCARADCAATRDANTQPRPAPEQYSLREHQDCEHDVQRAPAPLHVVDVAASFLPH
eukprot:scaffold276865_cov33-Tisochrysis_lutea.AAC.3